jgi:hypothetical protein
MIRVHADQEKNSNSAVVGPHYIKLFRRCRLITEHPRLRVRDRFVAIES